MSPVRMIVSVAAIALLVSGSSLAARGPQIALEQVSPVVVMGSGFTPSSRVKVTVTAATAHLVKTVVANDAGKLTARWQTTLHIDGCHAGAVTAVGSDGRQATWKPVHAKNCGALRLHDPANPVDPGK